MERRKLPLIEVATNFFDTELKIPGFSDENARIEFYTLAHGTNKDIEAALFDVLKQHRPHVARVVKEELEINGHIVGESAL